MPNHSKNRLASFTPAGFLLHFQIFLFPLKIEEEADIQQTQADLQKAQKANLDALKSKGRQHILVEDVDPLTGLPRVRGIFSATHIGRLLGVPVLGFDLPQTFAEIEAALAN